MLTQPILVRLAINCLVAQVIFVSHLWATQTGHCQSAPVEVLGIQHAEGFDVEHLDRINSIMSRGVADGTISGCCHLWQLLLCT